MYVRLHASIAKQPDIFPEHARLTHLIKLIIDEGGDHYRRFLSIEQNLSGLDPKLYLRQFKDAEEGTELRYLQDLCDITYNTLLSYLQISFALSDKSSGKALEASRREIV